MNTQSYKGRPGQVLIRIVYLLYRLALKLTTLLQTNSLQLIMLRFGKETNR